MKRWIARKLQRVVEFFARPVTTAILNRLNALHDAQQIAWQAQATAKVDRHLYELCNHLDETSRAVAEASVRDLKSVVRMLAAVEARLTDLQARSPESDTTIVRNDFSGRALSQPSTRHVVFLGAHLDSYNEEASSFLRTLRAGLDRLEDEEGQPEIWIEGPLKGADADRDALSRDDYVRIMKGGTRSVEVLRPDDACALRAALDDNGRSDVAISFRWLPNTAPQAARQALTSTEHWIFPSRECARAVSETLSPSEERLSKHFHVHPLPAHTGDDPAALARAYRRSVMAVLENVGTGLDDRSHDELEAAND